MPLDQMVGLPMNNYWIEIGNYPEPDLVLVCDLNVNCRFMLSLHFQKDNGT